MKRRTWLILLALALVGAGCSRDEAEVVYDEGPHLLVQSGGEVIEPYMNATSGRTWQDGSWIRAERPLIPREEIAEQLPELRYDSDFALLPGAGVTVGSISVYREDLQALHECEDIAILGTLYDGLYYVSVTIDAEAPYIPEGKANPRSGFQCRFRLRVEDRGEAPVPDGPPLRIQSGSGEVVPYLHLRSAKHWDGEHWVMGDGKVLVLDELEGLLPELRYDSDFALLPGEGVTVGSVTVYDEGAELLYQDGHPAILQELPAGDYTVSVGIRVDHPYVSEGGDNPTASYHALFQLNIP